MKKEFELNKFYHEEISFHKFSSGFDLKLSTKFD